MTRFVIFLAIVLLARAFAAPAEAPKNGIVVIKPENLPCGTFKDFSKVFGICVPKVVGIDGKDLDFKD